MQLAAITDHIDLAQIAMFLFTAFFIGLVFYLRREDRREGYPLEADTTGELEDHGVIWTPEPKVFKLPDGGEYTAPHGERDTRELKLRRTAVWPGAAFEPTGDPLVDGVGPASYAERADVPDVDSHGKPRQAPLRAQPHFAIAKGDPDPRGYPVVAADGKVVGKIVDIWVDHFEAMTRYLEAELAGDGKRILIPNSFARVNRHKGEVKVIALASEHFAKAPVLKNPEQVTLREEDRICGFFGGGELYGMPGREEPLL